MLQKALRLKHMQIIALIQVSAHSLCEFHVAQLVDYGSIFWCGQSREFVFIHPEFCLGRVSVTLWSEGPWYICGVFSRILSAVAGVMASAEPHYGVSQFVFLGRLGWWASPFCF